ncbi:MAG: DUF4386 family protein [Proteobacteria bacterium]|nr:DUF4386 family protein [Pseudomonadota bacterium]
MAIEIAMRLSGFLFLFILVLNFVMVKLGKKMEVGDYDSDAKLKEISDDPKKFQISVVLALIEHISIIALAFMLFVAFNSYSLILGIIWTIFRTGEGLIHIDNEIKYWGLLNVARQYADASGAEINSLRDSGSVILQTYDSRFAYAMILWSIGTLAYSILFVTYGVIPTVIGWLGIATAISWAIGEGIKFIKPGFNILIAIGGLSAMLFEFIIGGWLLFFSHIIP